MPLERVFVGLGANLGDALATLKAAVRQLAGMPGTRLVAVSSFYRSSPVQAQGPDFVNAVAELATTLEPLALLRALQAIEGGHGRERPYANAPRTLDLDLLMYGQRVVTEAVLSLPHPRLVERAFVLLPLVELAPGLLHPSFGPLAVCASRITGQSIERLPAATRVRA